MEPDDFWLSQWDRQLAVWENTVSAQLALHFRRAERVAVEKLGGRKSRDALTRHYAQVAAGTVEPVRFEQKAAATAAGRSAAAKLAWQSRQRGVHSTPSTPSSTPTSSPAPSGAHASVPAHRVLPNRTGRHTPTRAPAPAPAPPPAPASAPGPAAPKTFPRQTKLTPNDLKQLNSAGNATSYQQHAKRRQQWIGGDPNLQAFADAAAYWISDYGTVQNQQYKAIRNEANGLIGSSRQQQVSTINPLPKAKARQYAFDLMAAAADAPQVPNLYRGLAMSPQDAANLKVGQPMVEALGSWTDNRAHGLAYGSYRQKQAAGQTMVLFEMAGGRGVGISPLAQSTTPSYYNGEEFLSSGVYTITGIRQSTEQPPTMTPQGLQANRASVPVTIVTVSQDALGFDLSQTPAQAQTKSAVAQAVVILPDGSLAMIDVDAFPEMPGGGPQQPEPGDQPEEKGVTIPGIAFGGMSHPGEWVGTKAINPLNLFNPVEWAKALVADATDWFAQIIGGFAAAVAGFLGVPAAVADHIIQAMAAQQAQRVAKIADTTARELANSLASGENASESADELTARVHDVFDRAVSTRAPVVATTEVSTAANTGSYLAAWQSQIKIEKVWWTRLDTKVRPTHQRAHGQRRGLQDPFDVGGAALMYPCDPAGPPQEVINCRCRAIMTPVTQQVPTKGYHRHVGQSDRLSHRSEHKRISPEAASARTRKAWLSRLRHQASDVHHDSTLPRRQASGRNDIPDPTPHDRLEAAVDHWKGSDTADIRVSAANILGGRRPTGYRVRNDRRNDTSPEARRQADLDAYLLMQQVAHGEQYSEPLYRGMLVNPDDMAQMLRTAKPGKTLDVPLASFSKFQGQSERFALSAGDRTWVRKPDDNREFAPVLMTVQGGAKGIDPTKIGANDRFDAEQEVVTSGRFRVVSVEPKNSWVGDFDSTGAPTWIDDRPGWSIVVEQTDVFDPDKQEKTLGVGAYEPWPFDRYFDGHQTGGPSE